MGLRATSQSIVFPGTPKFEWNVGAQRYWNLQAVDEHGTAIDTTNWNFDVSLEWYTATVTLAGGEIMLTEKADFTAPTGAAVGTDYLFSVVDHPIGRWTVKIPDDRLPVDGVGIGSRARLRIRHRKHARDPRAHSVQRRYARERRQQQIFQFVCFDNQETVMALNVEDNALKLIVDPPVEYKLVVDTTVVQTTGPVSATGPVALSRLVGGSAINQRIRFNPRSGLFEATPESTNSWGGLTRGRSYADIAEAILYQLESGNTIYYGDDPAYGFAVGAGQRGRNWTQHRSNSSNPLVNIWRAGDDIHAWICVPHWTAWAGSYDITHTEWGEPNVAPRTVLDSEVEHLLMYVNGVEFDVQVTVDPLPGDRPDPTVAGHENYNSSVGIVWNPRQTSPFIEEIPIDVRNRVSTVHSRYLFVSDDGSFSSSEALGHVAVGTSYAVPDDLIPVGESRFLAIGRPISELGGADFSSVTYPPSSTPRFTNWVNVGHTVSEGGTVLKLIRTRTAVGPAFNGRTVLAV